MLGMLGRRAMNAACIAAAGWDIASDFQLHVNVNVQQLASGTFLADIGHALRAGSLGPERLVVEITETARLPATGQVLQNLTGVRSMGIAIELDDFGTGFCSPLYLKQLPITGIKVDRQFVSGLGLDTSDDIIVEHLASLASRLGLTVCGEGVETVVQQQLLCQYGIDAAQGWLFSPAVSATDFATLLHRRVLEPVE
jgi:diguanylate cyclase